MAGPVVVKETILAALDNDTDLLREVIALFLMDCPKMLAAVHSGVAAQDRVSVVSASHALKGSVSNFGAENACQMAHRLETMARHADWSIIAEAASELGEEMARVTSALERIRKEIN